MIAATTHAAKDLPWVRVTAGDADHPDFPAGSFDAVTAGFMVFLLPDPPAAVARWARLLRPGGRLALSTFAEATPAAEAFYRDRTAALAAVPDCPTRERSEDTQNHGTAAGVGGRRCSTGADLIDVTMTEIDRAQLLPHHRRVLGLVAVGRLAPPAGAGARRSASRRPGRRSAKVLDQHLRQPDGGYRMETGMRLTVARRPG